MEDTNSQSILCCGIICKKKTPETTNCCSALISRRGKSAVFCGELPQPLLPGHCIEVLGSPLKHCESFAVDLVSGDGSNADVALHFNPRLVENYVARNSKRNGKWEIEETTAHLRLDLHRNRLFRLSIFISPTEFMISINGVHFCVYHYRIPLTRVKLIEIYGDVNINDVDLKEMEHYPAEDDTTNDCIPFEDIYNGKTELQNPFIGHLPEGFQTGWQLEIYGKVKLMPYNFYVNLQEGNYLWPHPTIPLHINPRFDNRILTRNAWENGGWGAEERSPGFHFMPSKQFRLVVQLDMDREIFIVWVDGQLEGEFRIRNKFNVEHIDTVYIQGDIYIYRVFVRKNFTNVIEDSKI